MEELQAKHRKELKDLQARITQKKKQASKKTRKGVNDECDRLEKETKERQELEIAELNGESTAGDVLPENDLVDGAASLSLTEAPSQSSSQPPPSAFIPVAEPETPAQNEAQTKKPNRARARMERRKAEQEALFNQASTEASNLPDLKAQERERMVAAYKSRGLEEKEIRADGHCLYSAFADQMEQMGLPLGSAPDTKPGLLQKLKGESLEEQQAKLDRYRIVRRSAAEYIQDHPDDFAPFLEEPLDEYIHKVRDTGEWGGQLELLALARRYEVQINVLQDFGRVEEILPEGTTDKKVWLAYYRHGFGLGEHYNSLRQTA